MPNLMRSSMWWCIGGGGGGRLRTFPLCLSISICNRIRRCCNPLINNEMNIIIYGHDEQQMGSAYGAKRWQKATVRIQQSNTWIRYALILHI